MEEGACQEASSSWIWLPLVTVMLSGAEGTVAATATVASLVSDSSLSASSVKVTCTLIVLPRSAKTRV